MNDVVKAMYLTDDRDRPEDEQRALVIFLGGKGDWYVQVTPPHGHDIYGVRICTSGGAATHCPGLGVAIADAYRAMTAAQRGEPYEPKVSRDELEREVCAWRERFAHLRFDGFAGIEDNAGDSLF